MKKNCGNLTQFRENFEEIFDMRDASKANFAIFGFTLLATLKSKFT